MRILHVDTGREMRGGQWQALYLTEQLRSRGHQCVLLAPADSPLLLREKESGGEAYPLTFPSLWKWSRWAGVVHAHTASAHTRAAFVSSAKLVVSRRVAFPVNRGVLSRWKYSRPARYIAVSRFVKEMLLAADVNEERISVVYDGVPEVTPANPSERIVAPFSDDPLKGASFLKRLAGEEGLAIHHSRNLAADLADAAVFLYVTGAEGLGSGALLAMSAGVPVVASRVGGLPEAVEDGVTGVLVENDVRAVAEVVRNLMSQPEKRLEMGKKGRERVSRMFTLEKMAAETLRLYEEVAG